MKETACYVCDHCGSMYINKKEAEQCESLHQTNLNIVDMKHGDDGSFDYGYPEKILVEIVDHSGCLAEYILHRADSVEGFEPYHPQEYYNTED